MVMAADDFGGPARSVLFGATYVVWPIYAPLVIDLIFSSRDHRTMVKASY